MLPQASPYPKSNPGTRLPVFACLLLLVTLGAAGIILNNIKLLAVAGTVPVVGVFLMHTLKLPHLAILGVTASYMLDIEFNFSGITPNIILVVFCLLFIVAQKKQFIIIKYHGFLFFITLYIFLILFSYSLIHRNINFYDINLYINNLIILLLMFIFDTKTKIESIYKVMAWCSMLLVMSGFYQIMTTGLPANGMTGYWPNHVRYALHIAWGIPVSYYFFRFHRSRLYGLVFIFLMAGAILAFSRGVLMALILAAITATLLNKWPALSPRKRLKFIATGSVVGIAFSFFILNAPLMAERYTADDYQRISSGRTVLYQAAWQMFKENPITGVGWEQFRETWPRYVNVQGTILGDKSYNTHSSYLKILAELGLVGMAIYLLFNFCLWKSVADISVTTIGLPLLTVLLIYYFHGMVDNNSYGNDRMFYIAAGLLYSIKQIKIVKKNFLANDFTRRENPFE